VKCTRLFLGLVAASGAAGRLSSRQTLLTANRYSVFSIHLSRLSLLKVEETDCCYEDAASAFLLHEIMGA
jgi:hypothetical protein